MPRRPLRKKAKRTTVKPGFWDDMNLLLKGYNLYPDCPHRTRHFDADPVFSSKEEMEEVWEMQREAYFELFFRESKHNAGKRPWIWWLLDAEKHGPITWGRHDPQKNHKQFCFLLENGVCGEEEMEQVLKNWRNHLEPYQEKTIMNIEDGDPNGDVSRLDKEAALLGMEDELAELKQRGLEDKRQKSEKYRRKIQGLDC